MLTDLSDNYYILPVETDLDLNGTGETLQLGYVS